MNIYNDITLIIVCFKSEDLIKKNLSQIKRFNTIIVDNSRSLETETLVKDLTNIKYVKTNKNLGYGKACNLGVTYCSTPFIIFLNPDILIDPISIEKLYNFFYVYENVGLLVPSLYDENNNRRTNGSPSILKKRYFKKKKIYNYNLANGNACYDYAIGCAFLFKKDFFESIGGFDEDFFMYFEDNEICDRIYRNNKTVIEVPDSKMIHLQGKSSKMSLLLSCKLSIFHKISEYIYYKKSTSFLNLSFLILKHIFDFSQRLVINFFLLRFAKSFKNFLRLISIFLYVSSLYRVIYYGKS